MVPRRFAVRAGPDSMKSSIELATKRTKSIGGVPPLSEAHTVYNTTRVKSAGAVDRLAAMFRRRNKRSNGFIPGDDRFTEIMTIGNTLALLLQEMRAQTLNKTLLS